LLAQSPWDGVLVLLSAAQGAALALFPIAPLIGLGVWWGSNTVSHNFIHKPFFGRRWLNVLYSFYLSLLLGIPQSIWRIRHLAHHAGRRPRLRPTWPLVAESLLVLGLWAAICALDPRFFLLVYLPGYLAGLGLCALHGHFEHARGTTSHYGKAYNLLFFNDGYHVEHHRAPGAHWTSLPRRAAPGTRSSRWPPVLRWCELAPLELLERLALSVKFLQAPLIASHERAFRALLPRLGGVRRVAIVGGGLFPRTALILRRLLPGARLVVIDARLENLRRARPLLGSEVKLVHGFFDPGRRHPFDLVVVPLAFMGCRKALYRGQAAPAVLVHDWIWRKKGDEGATVSPFLLKRLNLVRS
jgi:fatty acid desaturase